MTFEEMQRIVLFAKKQRVRCLSLDGLTFELFPAGPRKQRTAKGAEPEGPAPIKIPSLDDVNKFIYENPEDKAE